MSNETWPNIALRDLATDIKDGTHGTHSRVETGIPFLSAKNVTPSGHLVWSDDDEFISESEYHEIVSGFSPKRGDLLITVVGTLGRTALFDGSKVAFQRSVAFVRPNSRLMPHYLLQASKDIHFQRQMERRSNATAQSGLYLGELAKICIPLPELNQQARIAEILSTVDEAIEQTGAQIAKAQQIKAGLMHDLLTRGVTANGRLRPSRAEAPQLYKESPLGWIPKEWNAVPLRELSAPTPNSFVNGPFGSDLLSSELQESGVPVVYVQDVKPDGFRKVSQAHVNKRKADELAFCSVRPGDVLVAKVGTPPGDSALYRDAERAVITQDVIRIRPAPDARGDFIAGLLNSSVGSKAIRRIMIEGTRGRVSLTDFKKIIVPKPLEQEQRLIAARIEQTLTTIDSLERELHKLHQVKHGMMHDLLTGSVRASAGAAESKVSVEVAVGV